MKKELKIEQVAECRWFYHFKDKTKNDETLTVEVSKVTNQGGKNSLPYLWKKHGYTNRVLENYWVITTYVEDEKGSYGRYNPTIKNGKINFDWIFEATKENLNLILDEIIRLAY